MLLSQQELTLKGSCIELHPQKTFEIQDVIHVLECVQYITMNKFM